MSKDEHKERQRVTKACDNCRKKKIKCDAKADVCTSCELLQIPCQYLDPTKKRGPSKGAGRYINAIEDRLHRMESIVGGTVEDEPKEGSSGDAASATQATGTASSTTMATKPRRRKSTKSNVKPTVLSSTDQKDDHPKEQQPSTSQLPTPQDSAAESSQQQQYSAQQQFYSDNSFQQQQQQHHQHMHQQQQSHRPLHPSHLSQGPTQSPERTSQTYADDMQRAMEPHTTSPVHSDLLRDNTFQSFNSPSPILGSEHSQSDFNSRSPGVDTLPQLGMNTPPMPELDDLEEDMGHLTLDHKGHERYVGKSSPMFYNRRHWGGYSIREREQPEARKFVDNPDLPTPEVMTRLLNLYFAYIHPFAPVFVWSKFLRRLQNRDYSPSFLFLLNSIFALASRYSDDLSFRTDPTKPETVGVRFVEKAKAILDTIYDAPDMYCVGGLVLLSYQQMGTGGGYRAWMFIGLSIRMAQHLGLNRDCMKLNPHMPVLDREERNRIWWTCFVADRLVSASFGRPQGINEHDVDATYPEGIDEENIQLEFRLDNASSMLTGPSSHSEKNFVYMASLTRIMGRVMVSLYSPLSRASSLSSSSMTNPAPLEQLDKELTDWLLTLPPHLQFRSVQQEPGTFVCTLHMTFYATLILLHRPYSHQSPHNTNDWSISLSICTSAANNTIGMASNLMRTSDDHRDVPRLKCLLHSAVFIFFTAGLVHINNCTSMDPVLAASAKLRTVETLRCLSVIEDVWISGKWCGNNIKNLLKSRNIELPCSVEGFKYTIRNGADPASVMNGVNPAQLDLFPTQFVIPKEQSFAFDVDQIMGYYQAPGIRHAEPMGRNSRHFSPTPYFSPISPHHVHNQVRSHPGLIQGHAPLPRRPRQTKNTSPSPGRVALTSNPSGGTPAFSTGVPADTIVTTSSTSSTTIPNPNFYSTPLLDPFAVPGATTVAVNNGLQQPSTEATATAVSLHSYQNPFSNTLWTLPASIDNDEWMLYMQNGGANGPVTPGDDGIGGGLQQQRSNSSTSTSSSNHSGSGNHINVNHNHTSSAIINTNSDGNGGHSYSHANNQGLNSGIKGMTELGSSMLLDNNSVNLSSSNHSNLNHMTAAHGNRVHPLAQSLTRNDLMSVTGPSGSMPQQPLRPDNSTPNGSMLNGGYSPQHTTTVDSTAAQQPQLGQRHQQPLLASQGIGSNEYAYYLNNGTGAPSTIQQTTVTNPAWGA